MEVDAKLVGIEKSQQFLADQYETFRAQVGHVLKSNVDLKSENEKLATRIKDLEKKDKIRSKTIDDLEQYGRREMFEIGGVPRSREEDCEKIAINLADKLGLGLERDNIEAAHRISKRDDAPIIAKTKSRKTCHKILSKEVKYKCRKLKISDLGYPMPTHNPGNTNVGKI